MSAKILVSQCFLGDLVTYNQGHNMIVHQRFKEWVRKGWAIPICPEVSGGMSIPRPPSEIRGPSSGEGVLQDKAQVLSKTGEDVSAQFLAGAQVALKLAQKHNIKIAVLKDRSPSCGSLHVYDGSFSRMKVKGTGVTTALLQRHGIQVFNELEVEKAMDLALNSINS